MGARLYFDPVADDYVVETVSEGAQFLAQKLAASGIAGSDTEVQFNDGGSQGADSAFTFDKALAQLDVGGFEFHGDAGYIQVPTSPTPPAHTEGVLYWDTATHTLSLMTENSGTIIQVGHEMLLRVRNETGSAITEASPVYISGVSSGLPLVSPADADLVTAADTIGIITTSGGIANNSNGYVCTYGRVNGVDTTGTPVGEVWSSGDALYVSTTTGALTNSAPSSPAFAVRIGYVVAVDASNGSIEVTIAAGGGGGAASLGGLSDVTLTAPAQGEMFYYDASTSLWRNATGLLYDNVLDDATGDEVGLSFSYEVNKATSGADTGLLVSKTDTASPGTSLLVDLQTGSITQFSVEDAGDTYVRGVLTVVSGDILTGDGNPVLFGDSNSSSSGLGAVSLGAGADANGDYAVAIGLDAQATAIQTTTCGGSADATVQDGSAFGYDASVSATGGTAVGALTVVSGVNGGAFGYDAESQHQSSYAIGNSALTTQTEEIILGSASVGVNGHRVVIPGTESATDTTTGALRVAGGVGVAGAAHIGNTTAASSGQHGGAFSVQGGVRVGYGLGTTSTAAIFTSTGGNFHTGGLPDEYATISQLQYGGSGTRGAALIGYAAAEAGSGGKNDEAIGVMGISRFVEFNESTKALIAGDFECAHDNADRPQDGQVIGVRTRVNLDDFRDGNNAGEAGFVRGFYANMDVQTSNTLDATGTRTAFGTDVDLTVRTDGASDEWTAAYGGRFNASAAGAGTTDTVYGLYSQATGGTTNWAAYLDGNVRVTGKLTVLDVVTTGGTATTGKTTVVGAGGSPDATTDGTQTIYLLDASANTCTLNLDAAPADGRMYYIKVIDASNTVTVSPNGGTIDGSSSDVTLLAYEALTLIYDSTNGWLIL